MTEIKRINKQLADRFGKHLDGRPKFRLAWSEDLYEWREGYYEDWYGSIFIRAFQGTRYVRKYTMTHNVWILEHLVFEPNSAIKGSENGHYEYLRSFKKDANGKAVKPTFSTLEFIINLVLNGPKATVAQIKDMEVKDRERFIQEAMDILEDESPFLASKLHDGTAIVSPGVR